jgi:hypothetical protein
MNNYTSKPHISAALSHLRSGVTGCAVIVLMCAVVQMLVFGFVHFTEVRWQAERGPALSQPIAVVTPGGTTATWREVTVPTNKSQYKPPPVHFPRPTTAWDSGLNVASDMAATVGIAACFLLAGMTMLGVAVGGGASVPGIERATSAAMWAMLLAAACIPWHEVFVSVPYAGIFGSYEAMTALSHAVDTRTGNPGAGALLFTNYVLMPSAALAGAMLVLTRFRLGIEQGVIVTSVNELDERLEREMQNIRARGVTVGGPTRAVGALNQAIGEKPSLALATEEPQLKATCTTGKPSRNWLSRRAIGEADPGDRLQRPI